MLTATFFVYFYELEKASKTEKKEVKKYLRVQGSLNCREMKHFPCRKFSRLVHLLTKFMTQMLSFCMCGAVEVEIYKREKK